MIRKTSILTLALFIVLSVSSQSVNEKSKCSCRFRSVNQLGALEGEAGTAFQFQSINGVEYATWFAGVGIGLDYYRYRGVPLFLDVRKNMLNRNRTPFVYGDVGMHFAWVIDDFNTGWGRNEYSNGIYYGFGFGYQLGLRNKKDAFVFSLGYSFKRLEEKRYSTFSCIFPPCDEQLYETLNFGLRRLSFQVGFSF